MNNTERGTRSAEPVSRRQDRVDRLFLFLVCVLVLDVGGLSAQRTSVPRRIISVVPAATEMLFATGAGPRVVAVSSFDEFPPEVARLPRVGALLDPDLERILTLKPDLVIVYASQHDLIEQLRRAGIGVFEYRHGTLADVLATIRELGTRTGVAGEAAALAKRIERRLDAIRDRVRNRPRPRTLVVFGREPLTLRNLSVNGGIGFMHDLVDIAGGEDVFGDVKRESVQASTETVLARAPEVIIELRANAPSDIPRERRVWATLASLPAVRHGRVEFLVGDEMVVPGPRIADAAERLADVLHPEGKRKDGR